MIVPFSPRGPLLLCRRCHSFLFRNDETKIYEIRVRVPGHLKDDFYAAVPAGHRSKVIRDLLVKYLENQSQGSLFP